MTTATAPIATTARRRRAYVTRRLRIAATILAGTAWAIASFVIDLPWIRDLGHMVTYPLALVVVLGIAIIPGYLNLQLLTSVLLDRPKPLPRDLPDAPGVTVLVAAYNEADEIEQTLDALTAQDYPGEYAVIVIDDGSTDTTRDIVRAYARRDPRVSLLCADHGGKSAALNHGLAAARSRLIATVDADTLLVSSALRRAVTRLQIDGMVACAGSVLARNGRQNLLARMQEWDYQLGITAVKRQQALLGGTLVAQGAFSVYRADEVRAVGGWPDMIGEDIVVTWALLERGGVVGFEPTAIAFTTVPSDLRRFAIQRQRWARGMIEGLRTHGGELLRRRAYWVHGVVADAIFPILDLSYSIAVPAGIVLACFGNFAIVGPLTLLVLPLNLLMSAALLHRERAVFREVGIRFRRNRLGFLVYFLGYQLIMSPISCSGYVKELAGARRVW
jgi:biofilm PGA synthesis N-glycosyltransferase PgaC